MFVDNILKMGSSLILSLSSLFFFCRYELDLLMRGAFGYGLPNNQGQVIGSLYISNLTQRLTQDDTNLFLEFGHDTTIDLILTTLGLANDRRYPTDGPVNPSRNWRVSCKRDPRQDEEKLRNWLCYLRLVFFFAFASHFWSLIWIFLSSQNRLRIKSHSQLNS